MIKSNSWLLFIVVLCVILYAGFTPKDFSFNNQVSWLGEREGIEVGDYGLVYAKNFLSPDQARDLNTTGFSFELAFETVPETSDNYSHFNFLVQLYAADDESQLIIAQWQNKLIVMNGDDYSYRRRLPRIEADLLSSEASTHFLSLTVDNMSVALYLDGQRVSQSRELGLSIPSENIDTSLVVGNSVYANSFYAGKILDLAINQKSLTAAQVNRHYQVWRNHHNFMFTGDSEVYAYYSFSQLAVERVIDNGLLGLDLKIPKWNFPLAKQAFVNPLPESRFDLNQWFDFVLNLLGFIPFGYALMIVLFHSRALQGKKASDAFYPKILPSSFTIKLFTYCVVVICAALVSLTIESAQAWIPSRNSSLLDFALNTTGGYVGAWCYYKGYHHRVNMPLSDIS